MSFILDALKKSEAERRQGDVPKLQNEPFSAPPRRSVWPLLLVAALLLNAGVLGWWLLIKSEEPPPAAAVTVFPESARQPAADLPRASHLPESSATAASVERVAASPAAAFPPDLPQQAAAPPRTEATVATVVMPESPAAGLLSSEPERPTAPSLEPVAPAPAKIDPSQPAVAYPPLSDLPANARAVLPGLDLQLHFYTPVPERRLVRLNGHNLHEGEGDGDGLRVEEITPDGVRLDCRGVRFFLPAGRRPISS